MSCVGVQNQNLIIKQLIDCTVKISKGQAPKHGDRYKCETASLGEELADFLFQGRPTKSASQKIRRIGY